MSLQKFTQRQQRTYLLLLLYLLATLLPATPLSVAAQAAPCGETNEVSAIVAGADAPAEDQPVKMSKEEVDAAALRAHWNNRYTEAEQLHGAIFNTLWLAMGNDFTGDPVKLATLLDERFNQAIPPADLNNQTLYPYDDIVHTAFDVILSVPEVAHLAPKVWRKVADAGEAEFGFFTLMPDSTSKVSASVWRYSQSVRMLASSSDILAKVHDCAQKNPAVAAAFDKFNADKLNAGITDDAMEILAKNLDISFPEELRGRIAADGTITIPLDELKQLSQEGLGQIHSAIDSMQETLVEIDQQQKVIVDYIKNEELKAKHQEMMKKKAAETQRQLEAAKTSISVLTTLFKKVDPQFAKEFNVVANTSLQVGVAFNGWLKAVAGAKGLDKLASLSTIAFTGNVISAVMNIVSMFGEEKPTPEQLILEEIGRLRQQIGQLRTEMNSRFDRIDTGLNAIYTSMHDRFNLIDLQLGKIDGNVLEIQQTLLSLDLKLSQIERNNFELINAVGRRDFLNAVHSGLGYEERTGLQMAYEPDFINYETLFHTWGTVHAYDPGNAGPTQRDLSDAKVFEELNKYPLDLNLNYLNSWLIVHGLPGITDKYLASSRDWLFASRAYTQLGLESPDHMIRVDEQQQETLDKVGFEIDSAIQKISTQQTEGGPIGNTLLFSSVITYYEEKLNNLNSAIQNLEVGYLNEIQSINLQRAQPFDLFGGISQPLA